jgi:hypothetical protein
VTQADCTALGAGNCSLSESRRCFANPIQVGGHADPFNPVRGAIFCIPPTTSFAVNSSAGLPGPGTFELDFDVDVRCQSDPTIAWQFPDGANCPGGGSTTTTTTTTTTTLPPCGTAAFPTCGGACPGMQICAPNVVSMLCECL